MDEDIQLLKEFLNGDEQAFSKLVERHKEKVFQTIYSFFPDINEVDDIAQEVFLKVYFNAHSFKQKSTFTTWLYRITVNECYNALKKNKILSLKESANNLLTATKNTENEIFQKDLQKHVQKAIRDLPRKYALPVLLIDINNFTYKEAAEVLNISTDKLKVWLHRARKKLKPKLAILYQTYFGGKTDGRFPVSSDA